VNRILKEPLVHFLLGGTLLFGLSAWRNRGSEERPDEIVVSPAQIEVLVNGWSRIWERPPTPEEVEYLVDDYVREEVYYREALKLGLEQDDTIIRRRLRQKMEFLAEDFGQQHDPGDEELTQFLAEHADEFRKPAVLSFRHIYFSPDRRGDSAAADATEALVQLAPETDSAKIEELGDPFFLPSEFESSSEDDIARALGRDFVPKLLEVPPGEWSGPLRSGFGYHLVFVTDHVAGRLPALDEIRTSVLEEWQSAERDKYAEEFFERLRSLYSVTVEMPESLDTADAPEAQP